MKNLIRITGFILIALCWLLLDCRIDEDYLVTQALPAIEIDEQMEYEKWIDDIEAEACWKACESAGYLPGEDVVVALLDTGVNISHPDLINTLWNNQAEIDGSTGVDDDENGYIDDCHGVNLVNHYTHMTDGYGHGTQMAGVIAMRSGDGGGVGVAYGCQLMPVKCSTDNNFSVEDVIEGIQYAVANGADIINLSVAFDRDNEELHEAIIEASNHCVIVAAAGNQGKSLSEKPTYPAAYPEVIGVMASSQKELCSFSNFGYDIAAPGLGVWTTSKNGKYCASQGTSIATALVSGAVAIFAANESETPQQIKEKFLETQKNSEELTILNLKDLIIGKEMGEGETTEEEPPEQEIIYPDILSKDEIQQNLDILKQQMGIMKSPSVFEMPYHDMALSSQISVLSESEKEEKKSEITKTSTLPTATITKVKYQKKKLTIRWKKSKGQVDGYRIYIQEKAKGKYRMLLDTKKNSATIRYRAKRKAVTIKIATYRKMGKKIQIGKKSKAKRAKLQ